MCIGWLLSSIQNSPEELIWQGKHTHFAFLTAMFLFKNYNLLKPFKNIS